MTYSNCLQYNAGLHCSNTYINTNNYCYQYYNDAPNVWTYINWINSCDQRYGNHVNYSISGPAAYSLPTIDFGTQYSTKLKDAVAAIKKLRDEVGKLAVRKVKSTGAVLTSTEDPVTTYNNDTDFEATDKVLYNQSHETLANIQKLYTAITGGNGSGWPTFTQGQTTAKIADYNTLKAKLQELANVSTPAGYANNVNTGHKTDLYANSTEGAGCLNLPVVNYGYANNGWAYNNYTNNYNNYSNSYSNAS